MFGRMTAAAACVLVTAALTACGDDQANSAGSGNAADSGAATTVELQGTPFDDLSGSDWTAECIDSGKDSPLSILLSSADGEGVIQVVLSPDRTEMTSLVVSIEPPDLFGVTDSRTFKKDGDAWVVDAELTDEAGGSAGAGELHVTVVCP